MSVVSHNCGIFNYVSPSWFPNRDQKIKTASSTVLEASDFLAQPSILTPFPRLPLNSSLDSWERGTLVLLTTPLSHPTNLFCFLSPWTPLTPTCPSKPPLLKSFEGYLLHLKVHTFIDLKALVLIERFSFRFSQLHFLSMALRKRIILN